MRLARRTFLQWAAGTAALLPMSRIVTAQAYPTRPITLVVPFAAGRAVDTAAGSIAEKVQDQLQQAVVVEKRPGAGPMMGTSFVANAVSERYTLLLIEARAVAAKWLHKSVSFDVTSDFSPIAMIANSPLVLFAHPSVPFRSLNEL